MKLSFTAQTLNRITVLLLLLASVVYHVATGLQEKEEESLFNSGVLFSKSAFKNSLLPNSFFSY
jgi:hypothetical protein